MTRLRPESNLFARPMTRRESRGGFETRPNELLRRKLRAIQPIEIELSLRPFFSRPRLSFEAHSISVSQLTADFESVKTAILKLSFARSLASMSS